MRADTPPSATPNAVSPHPDHPAPDREPYRLWLHALAILLMLGTFCLVAVGGNVTSYGAGLAVPDWPGTFGYNMFLAPLDVWFRDPDTGVFFHGQFWEHSHRLLGAAVGVVTIVLALSLWFTQRRRPWLRWLGLALLGSIIVQGLLGGFRVTEVSTFLAGVHGVFGQLIFATTVLIAAALSRVWMDSPACGHRPRETAAAWRWELGVLLALPAVALIASMLVGRDPSPDLTTWRFTQVGVIWIVGMGLYMLLVLARLAPAIVHAWRRRSDAWSMPQVAAVVLLAALSLQLVLGAAVRHSIAAYAIPDAPLVYGRIVPPMTDAGLERVMATLPAGLPAVDPETTVGWVWLQYLHRVWAIAVTAAVIWTVVAVFRSRRHVLPLVAPPALLVVAFTFFQVLLGIMTVWSGIYPTMRTYHQATGAALLGLTTWLVVRTFVAIERGTADRANGNVAAPPAASTGYNPSTNRQPQLQGAAT